jgi:transcriptional regulator with XRE-family HTH domain
VDRIDVQHVAAQATAQARVLKHQADLAADLAIQQAVALALDSGMSQRDVARLTGVSTSSVSRAARNRPLQGVGVAPGADTSVYAFAEEWIWGSPETAAAVREALAQSTQTPQG